MVQDWTKKLILANFFSSNHLFTIPMIKYKSWITSENIIYQIKQFFKNIQIPQNSEKVRKEFESLKFIEQFFEEHYFLNIKVQLNNTQRIKILEASSNGWQIFQGSACRYRFISDDKIRNNLCATPTQCQTMPTMSIVMYNLKKKKKWAFFADKFINNPQYVWKSRKKLANRQHSQLVLAKLVTKHLSELHLTATLIVTQTINLPGLFFHH